LQFGLLSEQGGCARLPQSTATGAWHLGLLGRHGAVKLPQSTATAPNRHFKSVGTQGVTELPQSTATVSAPGISTVLKAINASAIKPSTTSTTGIPLPQLIENRFAFIFSPFA
jgi:hypothetical protein